MNNTLVLDTNAIIYFLGANPAVIPLIDQKIHYISVISEIKEIAIGIKKDYKAKVGDAIVCATAIYFDLPFISADKNLKRIKELNLLLFSP